MTLDLGRVGIWSRELRYNPDRGARAAAAAELEDLGYSAIFIPDAGGDVLGDVAHLLAATRRIPIATGVLNIWMHEAAEVARGRADLMTRFGSRFLLGLGSSHAPLVESAMRGPYTRPYSRMVEYLDALDAVPSTSFDAVPPTSFDAMPLASLDVAPLASLDAAAAASPDVAPLASLDVAPSASLDAAPLASLDMAPSAFLDAAPPVSLDVAPSASLDAAPPASRDAAPPASLDVAPSASRDAAPPASPSPSPRPSPFALPARDRMLAALGPRMLELARDRAGAAHPYLVPPAHTALAREALGPRTVLAPEQAVLLDSDPFRGRERARAFVSDYLALPNYVRNLRRLGFAEDDFRGGGSDRLVDALVARGDEEAVVRRVREHHDAGADHVCVYVIGGAGETLQLDPWRRLAPALTSL
jgi:alkanesulfonate monooxygenase SsuD/methylene tetrahydromethanopterin reductase-like flavin-dependent oxidoreductase (luciferase family)